MISITIEEIQRDLVSYFQRVRDGETLLKLNIVIARGVGFELSSRFGF